MHLRTPVPPFLPSSFPLTVLLCRIKCFSVVNRCEHIGQVTRTVTNGKQSPPNFPPWPVVRSAKSERANGANGAMAAAGSANAGTILQKLGLKPITKCSLAKFYVPAFGVASYTALSVNVMNPSLVIRVFPKKDITNFLLGSALVGTGSYIYSREHMKNAPKSLRAAYSITGAVLLSFGSVLVWAVLRSIVPPNPTLCTLAGIGSGLAFITVGSSYLNFVDGQVQKK